VARHLDDGRLLRLALTHRSFCAEVPGEGSNERLEYLGDAVLGLVVAEHLYRILPDVPEGDLARIRAAVVSEDALAPASAALGVGPALLLGRGEAHSGGREKPSILADALEALIGATFLAGGLEGATAFVLELMGEAIDDAASVAELGDPKNRLQELSARLGLGPPRYQVRETGPDHAKRYVADVVVAQVVVADAVAADAVVAEGERAGAARGSGAGRSKKQAERAAAVEALAALTAQRGPGEAPGGSSDA
jgi:ribonuclease-3